MDGNIAVKVAGVYADLPANSSFADVSYIMPWDLELATNPWIRQMQNPWGNYSFRLYVRIADNTSMAQVSEKIRSTVLDHVHPAERKYKNEVFLHPMSKWHLYNDFKNGVNTGGRIQFVWLFGIIGLFVLLLACINFMNLSTARSERRAKEVGIRKAIGSLRSQLIGQFYSESVLVSLLAFVLALVLVVLALPFFNDLADKKMTMPWANPLFWALGIAFSLITGILAGTYPALYLSSFNPITVLRRTFKAGPLASIPRKTLVVIQFTVSVILAIGTAVSYDYGKTVGWQFVAGRDFSRDFATDSSAFIINETAAKFMGLTNPVGEIIRWDDHPMPVIGVIKDVIAESPYEPVRPTLYHMRLNTQSFDFFKLNPAIGTREALVKIQEVYKAYSPLQPFDYKFADEEYGKKFGDEQRTAKLATAFAILAVFISCLGLFAMAAFTAEQRVKEIGVRKVLGASVFNLWGLLSKEFVTLVILSLLLATPVAWYAMNHWLQNYPYHASLPWWIFAAAAAGALVITLATISFQIIRAALSNPIKSLRTE